jgi:hypothetical protein
MRCLLALSSRCNYDSFVDHLSYGIQGHIDTSQLNGIFKVENFYDVADTPIVFWLSVSVAKHFKLYTFLGTAAGVMTVVYAYQQVCHFSLHGEFIFEPC